MTGPLLLDGVSLLAQAADDVVRATVQDTHDAIAGRVYRNVRRGVGPAAAPVQGIHGLISDTVFTSIALTLRAASAGADALAARGIGPQLEADPRGRLVRAAVNGLIGDELLRDRPQLAISMAPRVAGRDVDVHDAEAVRSSYPDATGKIVVFLHGLCEDEQSWQLHRDRTGQTYAEALADEGWTPVFLRANTGLPIRQNGVALASQMQHLVDRWPVPAERIALVGHSMGGLVMRASSAVMADGDAPAAWTGLVSDVVTLGTPHRGSWFAVSAGHTSKALGWLPESAAFGRIIDRQSQGIRDLIIGLAEDVPPLGHARYRLVSANFGRSDQNPFGYLFGDGLVRPGSATGRDGKGRELFPDATVLRVGRTDHFGLINHPEIHRALKEWLR